MGSGWAEVFRIGLHGISGRKLLRTQMTSPTVKQRRESEHRERIIKGREKEFEVNAKCNLVSCHINREVAIFVITTSRGEKCTMFFSQREIMAMLAQFYISNMTSSNIETVIKKCLYLFHFWNTGLLISEEIFVKGWYQFKYRYRYRRVSEILSIGGIGIGIGLFLGIGIGIGIGKKHGIGTSLCKTMTGTTVDIVKQKQRGELALQPSTDPHEISGETGNSNFVGEHENEADHNLRNLLKVQIAHNHLTSEKIAFLASKLGKNQRLDEVELRDCELDQPILEKFSVSVEAAGCKIEKFSISFSRNLKDLLPSICKIIECCDTKNLSIAENNVNGDELTKLEEILVNMNGTKLRGLDMSNNENLRNLQPLGKLIQSRGLTDLNLMSCELTDEQLESLSCVQGLLLQSVNIGFNTEITQKGFQCLSSVLHPKKIDLLDVTGCEMTSDKLKGLKNVLTDREVIELNVNYNDLRCPDMTSLGELAESSKVHMLGVAGCDLDKRRLSLFTRALGKHKFETLDATDNNKLGGCMKEVATLAKRCSALNISECRLQAEEIFSFASEMGESTIDILNVSDSNRVVTEKSRMLSSLCSLIPIVTKKLLLCFKEVNASSRVMIESKLIKLQKEDLTIVYSQSCYCEDQNGFHFVMSKERVTC